MVILEELPFKLIEREGFHQFMNIVRPNFKFVSRTTVVKDYLGIYELEKIRLKYTFAKSGQRVCLTTDLWTSWQILYMWLIAHFIDKD